MNSVMDDILMHYGMPRRSGRYPWGSGDDPYQRTGDFLARIEALEKAGKSQKEIAKELGIVGENGEPSTGRLRVQKAWAKDERRMYEVARIKSLQADGLGPTEIGRIMGKSESSIRSLLDPHSEARMLQAKKTADFIRDQIDKKGMIDIGVGVERELGISKEKLEEALYMLETEGYPIYKGGIPQATNPGQQTNQRVICPMGTQHKEIYNFDQVHPLNEDKYVSTDDGEHFDKVVYPKSLDSSRLAIRYADDVGPDGARGVDKDGVVELRRGVADLTLGDSKYSQVRILVDGNKYIKGMAVYSDDLPDGVDVMFNTNKDRSVSKMDVLKDIKNDPDNPFGSVIKSQEYYTDANGERQLSVINKRADQGDWSEWKDALPSQFLSKQTRQMAEKQLNLAKADKQAEYEEICSLNNPTVKKHLLKKFADECDSAAVNLQAAALPGQKYHVIIPINSLKDTEIYAPNYENGTQLALVRYPHGGTFEIPVLTVNNKNQLGGKIIGSDSIDAVGINKKIADRLSGADFDGDTVMCIPTNDPSGKVKVKATNPLKGLEGFDPKMSYPEREGMRYMKDPVTGKDSTQMEMGKISNLITDMTLGGAKSNELAAAVRHSMVVIDAGKHKLDYKQSEIDNNIAALKQKYQRRLDADGNVHIGGASTIISRAKGEETVFKRQGSPIIDPETGKQTYKLADDLYYPIKSYNKATKIMTLTTVDGKKIKYNVDDADAHEQYNPVKKVNKETGEVSYTNKAGTISYKLDYRTQKSTRMAETDDAYSLVSDAKHPMEMLYADYANSMKSLANRARKEMVTTGKIEYDRSANIAYRSEVDSLMDKLNTALLNAPRERAANREANAVANAKIAANPDMKKSDIKKEKQRALTVARASVGSVSRRARNIEITDREWDAIQAGAISENKLKQILDNTDISVLRQKATPRSSTTLSQGKVARIKAMNDSNYTLSEIANALGVSTSTVSNYLKGEN